MKRSLVASIALSLALVAAMVPAVLAADSTADPAPSAVPGPSGPAPSLGANPSDAPPDDGTPPDGVISVDPTFITGAPSGAVLGAVRSPEPTLPPTDALRPATDVGGATLQALLAILAAFSALLLVAGRLPAVRHRLN